jgi:type IV pilus assembly protein PilO
MPRSFSGLNWKDPRVAMRAVIGALLVANLAAAVVALKPFGGSAEDLRRQQASLTSQLAGLQVHLARSKQLVENVQKARTEEDSFLNHYFSDTGTTGAMILTELNHAAKEAGIKVGQATFNLEPLEGSDTLEELTTQVGFEGSYANFTKFVNLLDKSGRFMVIESMQAAAPQQQGGQALNVTLKIDTFVRSVS